MKNYLPEFTTAIDFRTGKTFVFGAVKDSRMINHILLSFFISNRTASYSHLAMKFLLITLRVTEPRRRKGTGGTKTLCYLMLCVFVVEYYSGIG